MSTHFICACISTQFIDIAFVSLALLTGTPPLA